MMHKQHEDVLLKLCVTHSQSQILFDLCQALQLLPALLFDRDASHAPPLFQGSLPKLASTCPWQTVIADLRPLKPG